MRTRKYGINIRVTEEEKKKLMRYAKSSKLTLSCYLRKAGLKHEIQVFPQDEFYEIYKDIYSLIDDVNYFQPEEMERELKEIAQKMLTLYLGKNRSDDDGSDENLADSGQCPACC